MQFPRAIGLFALAALPACIDTGPTPPAIPPMCEVSADCDSGETCDQGVCWGDPPAETTFAAVLVPPADRPDLAVTGIPALDIAQDGTISNLSFGPSVTITGRVALACSDAVEVDTCGTDTSIAAQIEVTRAAEIPGIPAFSRHVLAEAEVGDGEAAFTLVLPRIEGDGPGYSITVLPGAQGESSAAIAPPLRLTFGGKADLEGAVWLVGDPANHRLVSGRVVDAAGRGLAGMKVFAATGRQRVRLSSLATTDATGAFSLSVPTAFREPLDVVVRPGPEVTAPTLVIAGIQLPDPLPGEIEPTVIGELAMPSYPAPAELALPVRGGQTSGEILPVAGAQIELSTVLTQEGDTTVTFSATAVTDETGTAHIKLIPGAETTRTYRAHIASPPTSELGSLFGHEIAVGPATEGSGVLAQITLPKRVATSGTIANASGEPVAGATITASPSPDLLAKLAGTDLARVASTRFPQTTTDDSGNFVMWLDPALAGESAVYDFEIVPPAGAGAPRWSKADVMLDAGAPYTTHKIGVVQLPPASYARGLITAGGEPVPGAELRLYELFPDAGSARLRGLWQTRDGAMVWIVLPDP